MLTDCPISLISRLFDINLNVMDFTDSICKPISVAFNSVQKAFVKS